MTELEFRVLGPLEVRDRGESLQLGGAKQRALLAILLLNAGKVVPSEHLIDALWGSAAPGTAAKALQVHVSQLRRILEPRREAGEPFRVLLTRRPGYLIEVGPDQLDLQRFERLTADGRRALAGGDPASAAARLRDALALWRGPAIADLTYEDFARNEIARLEELRLAALEDCTQADLECGRHGELIGELERLVAEEPLRERPRAQLMLALYRSGRQAEALAAYREARRVLVDELGIEPGRDLQELERAVLQHDSALDLVATVEPSLQGTEPEPVEARGVAGFVGRERELGELLMSLEDAFEARGRLVLIGGEPGIGKSRLADELANEARRRGARVLVGRCWEAGGAPPFWPWVQSLRSYLRGSDPDVVRGQLGRGASDIAQMLPELRELIADLPSPPSLESEGARFRLFDATASFLRSAAQTEPLVLVLDDLHAADAPSLMLLQFVAGELADARVLIIGAYRDVELGPDHPLVSSLAEFQRQQVTRRMRLEGLTKVDVARFIELSAHLHPAEALTAAIHGQTEGNPLFVDEVVKLLAAEGRLGETREVGEWTPAIPQSVREVIGRRLHQISSECTRVLTLAAVLGREFNLDALGRISGLGADELLEVLDEAIAAHVLAEVPGSLGRLRFSHGLVRDVLYEELTPARRVRMHQTIGEALEVLYARDPEPHLAELCHHFFMAAPGGDPDKALDYARRAGDRAGASLAYEEAVRLYRVALQALDLSEPRNDVRCDLLLTMGDAQMRAGDGPGAKESFLHAAEIARRAQMTERLARAALGYGGRFVWSRAGADPHVVALLEEALSALDDGESALRVRLVARLSGALRDPPSRERASLLSEQAVEMARRLGDSATLAYALDARHIVIWGPDSGEERAAIRAEVVQLADETGDQERIFQGHFWRLESFLELGDLPAARHELEAAARLAESLRQPAQRWYVAVLRSQLALFEGRFGEAERLIEQALALGQQAQSWEALVYYRLQMFGLKSAQGRLDELDRTIEESVDEYSGYPVFRCVHASLLCELGREGECRESFEVLAADDFVQLPRDEEWLFGMTLLAPVCTALGDSRRAAVLYELLAPYSDHNALSVPEVSTGSVSRCLGILAAGISLWDQAIQHFEQALAMNASMGARPWVARTQHDYADMLLARDAPGDRDKAQELLAPAVETYRQLGMEPWAEGAAALGLG